MIEIHRASIEAFRPDAPRGFCDFLVETGKVKIISSHSFFRRNPGLHIWVEFNRSFRFQ
jgi:hypothetical protein